MCLGQAPWARACPQQEALPAPLSSDSVMSQPQPCSCLLSPELPAPARMEPTKLPLTKRMAPAPPVPAKTKPAPMLATKPSDSQPSTSADMERGRAGDPDANVFNMVSVTTARLSHPTATRPRVPGQRPPSIALGIGGSPCGGEQPRGLPHAGLCAPVASMGQAPVLPWSMEGLVVSEGSEGRSLALEDLKAEVRTLHILVDLMRVQHLRDLLDLRQELCQERAQRQALQVEIERVRKGLPC
ncbi:SH3 domain-containing kinase-binding protein 1-like isoform X2 [Corvus hawaiiensis]|uniref:SH3 domain-containing kinase-binding protein 1-like isoform X2 n=1 Tax=Corvus hawaiiensis TaxID=134902 RepID=UPI002018FE70|nr:SH3 domain-containing kinase-binding protein 1-like isoform X2 [Corvus hawaiiensis]